jgi:preprotein translocase subunit SecA
MANFLSKLFGGSKSEKDIKLLNPLVDEINRYFEQYKSLSNDELRGKTPEFRARIKDYLTEIDETIQSKKDEAEQLPTADMYERDKIYQEIDTLGKERDKKIEEILDQLCPKPLP